MKNILYSSLLILIFGLFLSGCIGYVPDHQPKSGYYKEDPAKFIYDYDKVWKATINAANDLDWAISSKDKDRGEIIFLTSYVYTHDYGKYKRIYSEPTRKQAEASNVKTYLSNISYWHKKTPRQAPPNPQYVRETMVVKVKPKSNSTEVLANYGIHPYFDYRIGYLGGFKSKGKLENLLYNKIGELLARKEDKPAPPPVEEVMEETFVLFDIFFDFDKDIIREDAKPVLLENAALLKDEPELTIVIHGYADVRGTNEYNIDLAMRRAKATRRYLVDFGGIDPRRLITLSKGETLKFAAGTSEEEYELNRRSHMIPVKPKAPVIYPEQ